MHVLYNQIKGGEGRGGVPRDNCDCWGGTNLQVVLIQKIFPWESEGKGGVFQGIFSLIW